MLSHARQLSSSSFAAAFDAARSQITSQGRADDEMEIAASPVVSSSESDGTVSPDESTPSVPTANTNVEDSFAFAFEIDGVLLRGGRAIKEAVEAMEVLNGDNEFGIKAPYIFITNSCGTFEAERCRHLSKQLEIDVSPGQFVFAQTPMDGFVERYETVLVVGGVANMDRHEVLGDRFRNIITPFDILRARAGVPPPLYSSLRRLLAGGGQLSDVVIDAVFVLGDSYDWATDLQMLLEMAHTRHGQLETRSDTLSEGPPIYFSRSSMLPSDDDVSSPPISIAALRHMLEILYIEASQGRQLSTYMLGGPQISTLEFATRLLCQWRALHKLHGLAETQGQTYDVGQDLDLNTDTDTATSPPPPETVYFVGNTPESDMLTSNIIDKQAEQTEWYSILVTRGVYQPNTNPQFHPREVVDTVLDAVNYAVRREMARQKRLPLDEL